MKNYKKYILLWLSQSISQLGSSMTGIALIIWNFGESGSAMSVSLMTFCSFVPYVIVSLFAGAIVDRHSKKAIMLVCDSIAALCTLSILLSAAFGTLSVQQIYIVNAVVGFMNAFQQPASVVSVGKLIPKEKLANASGMNSFSSSLTAVLSPVIAASLFSFGGLRIILLIDILSFAFAFFVLLFFIRIPEEYVKSERKSVLTETLEGFRFLRNEKGLFCVMLTMAMIMFFTMITYENILSPMILARSGSSLVLGMVTAVIGAGGIAGGVLVSLGKGGKNCVRMIYLSAALSFLLGDIMMAVGRNVFMWSIAGIAASLPIPFITAGQNMIIYNRVPEELQGRVFAVRNAVQFSAAPVGILLGGFLAEYVFEPFMNTNGALPDLLHLLVGDGTGSGMAVMFLITGVSGFVICCLSAGNKDIRALNTNIKTK